jgi:cell shape-determining protein MreC
MTAQDTLWQRLEQHAKIHDLLIQDEQAAWAADLRAAAQIVKEADRLQAENETLRAKLAESQQNDERYRWLRAHASASRAREIFSRPRSSLIDAAIDAAKVRP